MASANAVSSTSGPQASQGDKVQAIYHCVTGHMELSPKFVRVFLNKECSDKQPSETYKEYFVRLRGSPISDKQWKNWCNFSSALIESSKNLDKMDITACGHLYSCIFKAKHPSKDTAQMELELKNLKSLRNNVMHSYESATDPAALSKLEVALQAWIQVAGDFYSLPQSAIDDLKKELDNDIKADFSPGTIKLRYNVACVLEEGWSNMQNFLVNNFKIAELSFSMATVDRSFVFYPLEIISRNNNSALVYPYTEIFKQCHNAIIVSGAAGAGKSTLLENIALEFINPQSGTSPELKDFQLLVYVQCRDHSTKTLREVARQQFRNVCTKIGDEAVVEALFQLRVLFLVDGFDECDQSMTVLQEIMKGMCGTSCRVIITCRTHAVFQLVNQLPNQNKKEFEIVPLEKREKQLEFLKKYEPYLTGRSEGALREAFKTLSNSLQKLFIQPVKLLQFCNVFVTFPDKIHTWKTPSDAARDIFSVYKITIAKKLAHVSCRDFDLVIDDLFLVLYDAALSFLRLGRLSFTADEIRKIQRKCRARLRNEHAINNLDTQVVFTSIFKVCRSAYGSDDVSYSFYHTTDEEFFASKSVVKQLDAELTIREILLGKDAANGNAREAGTAHYFGGNQQYRGYQSQPEIWSQPFSPTSRFLQVLLYVAQELINNHPELFERRRRELSETLREAGAGFSTWQTLVLCCSDDPSVVRWAAEEALALKDWEIETDRDLEAVALMLPYAQPELLKVVLDPLSLVGDRWSKILQHRKGQLDLKLLYTRGVVYTTYSPCDAAVIPLRHSRCQLVAFIGILTSVSAVSSLATVAMPDKTELEVWLQGPLDLSALRGKYRSLSIQTPPFAFEDKTTSATPLPARPAPSLTVKNLLLDSWEALVFTVQSLAPKGRRYCKLVLENCKFNAPDFDRAVVALYHWGVRTDKVIAFNEVNHQSPIGISRTKRKFKDSGKYEREGIIQLVITDTIPRLLGKVSNLLSFRDRAVDLWAKNPQKLDDLWPLIKNGLRDAGATYRDWQYLLLRCPSLPDLPELAAEAWLNNNKRWTMFDGSDVDAVALMLPHAQPSELLVHMDPRNLRSTRWPEVVRLWDGDLLLNLISDETCDDMLLPPHQSRCRLKFLLGRISTPAAVEAISAIFTNDGVLELWLCAPLQLSAFEGKLKQLYIHTKVSKIGSGEGINLALPSQVPPILQVEMSPLDSWEQVVYTVESFAPTDKRFCELILEGCMLNPAHLDKLMIALHQIGIRTSEKGKDGAGRLIMGNVCYLNIADDLSLDDTGPGNVSCSGLFPLSSGSSFSIHIV